MRYLHTQASVFVVILFLYETDTRCRHSYSKDKGLIHSPGYPNSYPSDKHCKWTISVQDGFEILLTFHLPFELDVSTNCTEDSVKVYDVFPNKTRNLRGTWCGEELPPDVLSTTSVVDVEFNSDMGNKYGSYMDGFSTSWSKVEKFCHKVIMDVEGEVMSPNYPSMYQENLSCRWEIEIPQYSSIVLTFRDDFNLGSRGNESCSQDRIEIFDVSYDNTLTSRGKWCGTDSPGVLESFGHKLVLEMHTDNDKDNNGRGFYASWKNVTSCGFNFTKDYVSGFLHSPYYPSDEPADNEPDYKSCTWTIDVEADWTIQLIFVGIFQMENEDAECEESVKVFDVYLNGTKVLRQEGCSIIPPPETISLTSKMEIEYQRSGPLHGKGFSARWKKVYMPCYDLQKGNEGSISLNNFYLREDDTTNCRWDIHGPVNQFIEIRFTTVNLGTNSSQSCDLHKIEVLDVLSNYSTVSLGQWCGSDVPSLIKSSGSYVRVMFHTTSFTGQDISVSWKAVSDCGGIFTPEFDKGFFHSPNYPSRYLSNQFCNWTIDVGEGYVVNLTFAEPFNVDREVDYDDDDDDDDDDDTDEEKKLTCTDDIVMVIDGVESSNQTKHVFCDTKVPPTLELSSTIEVVFKSDSLFEELGFAIFWVKVDVDECESDNGGCDHNCTNIPGSRKCSCLSGFFLNGTKCIDPCQNGLCHNGACLPKGFTYSCSCNSGWTGERCDVEATIDKTTIILAVIGSAVALSICVIIVIIIIRRHRRKSGTDWQIMLEDPDDAALPMTP